MSCKPHHHPLRTLRLCSVFLLLSLSLSSFLLQAKQPHHTQQGKPQTLMVRSNNHAAQIVKSRYGGKVLAVKSASVAGAPGYRVKLLTDNGRIIYVSVNAVNGRTAN
ncbi:PepSY domain-containing protein [Shewanella sp. YIC-542]|uniref:PepSY domain-containing protein n=1 Tax=Shewanella mytili TaxID=3377111 RepID=UPI00398EBA7E